MDPVKFVKSFEVALQSKLGFSSDGVYWRELGPSGPRVIDINILANNALLTCHSHDSNIIVCHIDVGTRCFLFQLDTSQSPNTTLVQSCKLSNPVFTVYMGNQPHLKNEQLQSMTLSQVKELLNAVTPHNIIHYFRTCHFYYVYPAKVSLIFPLKTRKRPWLSQIAV